jgi:hypothetical protein
MDIHEAIRLLTDEAARRGADAEDNSGIVRDLVTAHGFGFDAWLCVCMKLADRSAQREGYRDQFDRAFKRMKVQ